MSPGDGLPHESPDTTDHELYAPDVINRFCEEPLRDQFNDESSLQDIEFNFWEHVYDEVRNVAYSLADFNKK